MSGDVSTLLAEARSGAEGAAQRVFELLYGELKSLAHGQLNRHAVEIHAVDAAFEHHAPDDVAVLELVLDNRPAMVARVG